MFRRNKHSETSQRFSIKKYSFGVASALVGVFFAAGANYAQADNSTTQTPTATVVSVAQTPAPAAPVATPAPVTQTPAAQPATQVQTPAASVAQTTTQATSTSAPVAQTTTQAPNSKTTANPTAQKEADKKVEEKTKAEVKAAQTRVTPKWTANTVTEITAEIKRQEKEELKEYVVQWGDTLNRISKATGTSVADLVRYNNIKNPNKIFVGDLLKNVLYVTPSNLSLRNQANPQNRGQQNGRRSWIANSVEEIRKEIDAQTKANNANYVIKWGDTLSRISKASGKSVKELQTLNNIKNINKIYAGKELKGVLVPTNTFNIDEFTESIRKRVEELERKDTDMDGLNDYTEQYITFTDPNNSDTGNTGVKDLQKDKDTDSLTIEEELVVYRTNPSFHDTDYDWLNDGDEVKVYKTSPIVDDTDGDGARDGWEIKNGSDPLVKQDRFNVEKTTVLENGLQAKVSSNMRGDQVETLSITKGIHSLFNEEVPGLIGAPISLRALNNVDNAVLSIQFDKSKLSENSNLAIYYFNEDTQLLEEQSTTIVDNWASANLKHFSYYALIDKNVYLNQISNTYTIRKTNKDYGNKLNISFSIDTSGSMRENDPKNQRGEFIKEMIGKLDATNNHISIVDFDGYVRVLYPLGEDYDKAKDSLDYLDSNGGTSIDKGMQVGADQLLNTDAYKVVFLLTDGETSNETAVYDLLDNEKYKDVVFYTVGLGRGADNELLNEISSKTGGKHYTIDDVVKLENILSDFKKEAISIHEDTNKDGISNYYTTLIYTDRLRVGTGGDFFRPLIEDFKKQYPNAKLDDSSSELFEQHFGKNNGDFDGDGLKNGSEIEVITDQPERVYIKVKTNPMIDPSLDSDGDGFTNSIEDKGMYQFEDEGAKLIGWNFREGIGKENIWNVGPRDLAFFANLAYDVNDKWKDENHDKSKEAKKLLSNWENITNSKVNGKNIFELTEEKTTFGAGQFNVNIYANKNTSQAVLAFRGSDSFTELTAENSLLLIGGRQPQANVAIDFISKNINELAKYKDIYVAGHSLGGYLAYQAASKLLEELPTNLKGVINYSGPGIATGFIEGGVANGITRLTAKIPVIGPALVVAQKAAKLYITSEEREKFSRLKNATTQIKSIVPNYGEVRLLSEVSDVISILLEEKPIESFILNDQIVYLGTEHPTPTIRIERLDHLDNFKGSHEMSHFLEKIKQGYRGTGSDTEKKNIV